MSLSWPWPLTSLCRQGTWKTFLYCCQQKKAEYQTIIIVISVVSYISAWSWFEWLLHEIKRFLTVGADDATLIQISSIKHVSRWGTPSLLIYSFGENEYWCLNCLWCNTLPGRLSSGQESSIYTQCSLSHFEIAFDSARSPYVLI